jgi:hypothetical protein
MFKERNRNVCVPVRDLLVPRHEPRMDIRLLMQTPPSLHPNLLPKVQKRMHKRRRNTRKAQPITQRKRRRQEQRRIRLVLLEVQRQVRVENSRHAVGRASVVVRGSA